MKLPASVTGFEAMSSLDAPVYLAIGIFDGLHRGHRAVVDTAVRAANASGGVSGVLTFNPHPSRMFRPQQATRLILPIARKIELLHAVGVKVVIGKKFDADFASIEAADFAAYLKAALPSLKALSVGANFRYGRLRAGDATLLKASGKTLGLEVSVVERLRHAGEAISSTRIRAALKEGRIEIVNTLLGYNYGFMGEVVRGAQKGRALGFPTLNLPWEPECLPLYGVYRVRLRAKESYKWADGIANFGVKPTMAAEGRPALEVHLLEETQLDAGAQVEVEWLEFRRGEKKFETEEVLRAHIAEDVAWARKRASHG
ncbi:MAG: Riboflavin biosynthesis protein RibF [Opitutia bacterium UBA7350]|nr:MAG: Riboflavin biosynthesis protein RibF [Opitutae bacterium UBA7350]